jgi:serine/threonine protein kinase
MQQKPSRPGQRAIASSMPGRNDAPEFLGRFTLERLLSRSASGSTWLALDAKATGLAHVALKLFNRQFGELFDGNPHYTEQLERLRGRTISGLPTLRAIGNENGQYYAAFAWYGGDSLDQVMAGTVADKSLAERRRLIRQIARGLNKLHRSGFLHLSLTPATLFFQHDRKSLRMIDWGHMLPAAASDQFPGLLSQGVPASASPYVSPQAAAGEALNVRDDVFAFGRIAYELLTGDDPFEGHSPTEAAALGLHAAATPTLSVRQNRAISKALALHSDDRDVTLDTATRAFAGTRRPRSVFTMLSQLRRNPAHAGFIAIPVFALVFVYAALMGRDGAFPWFSPENPPVIAQVAAESSPAPVEETAPPATTPAIKPPVQRAKNKPSDATGTREQVVTQGESVPTRVTTVDPAGPSSLALAPAAARKHLDDFSRVGSTRPVACVDCDCPSLINKRAFTPEPLRREEQEYMRHFCS